MTVLPAASFTVAVYGRGVLKAKSTVEPAIVTWAGAPGLTVSTPE